MNEATVRQWIRKANNDLKIGTGALQHPDPVTGMICFHM